MKLQFSLTYILRLAFLIFHLTLSVSVAAEPRVSCSTSGEMENYAIDIVEKINKTALTILSTPLDQQTFENILRPWNRLSAQLAQDLDVLDALSKMDAPSSATASQIYDELHAYLFEVNQNPELRQTLINCSLSIAHNPELDPFQRYIGARFVEDDYNELVYLCGTAEEEEDSSAADCTVFSLKSGSFTEAHISDLAHKILSENADAVCIQEVAAENHAYDLYKALCRNYAHFVYVPPSPASSLSRNQRKRGMLIASKFGNDAVKILPVRSHRDRDDDKKAGGSWEAGVNVGYGGEDGPQFNGYVKGEAHDEKGNYVEGRADHNFNRNEGNVGVRGGNKDEEDK